MKKLITTIGLALACFAANAQNHATHVTIDYTLNSDLPWIMRYENQIEAFREADKAVTDFAVDALFAGSSSIKLWSTLKEDFPDLKCVNRGYGGSMIRDILYYYAAVFGKYQPANIVFYCDNDICGSAKRDVTMAEWFDLHRVIFQKMHADYPDAHIYALCVKYSDSRLAIRDKEDILNLMLKEYCEQNDWMTYVDVNTPLLTSEGTPDPKYFREDLMHINREGYKLWAEALKQAGFGK